MRKDKQGRTRLYGPRGKGRPSPNLKLPDDERLRRKAAGNKRWREVNKDLIREKKSVAFTGCLPTRPRPNVCECCGKPPINKALALDHDHITNKFRGWLCIKCNLGIGKLDDSISGLQKAIEYLHR